MVSSRTSRFKYFLLVLMAFSCILAFCACNNNDNTGDNDNPETPQEVVMVDEGECGDSITWKLMSDGVITLTGTGDMEDYDFSLSATSQKSPWYANKSSIKKVVVEQGITRIGDNAFFACSNVTDVSLPVGLLSIGESAFFNISATTFKIPYTVTSVEDVAINFDTLTTIEIPPYLQNLGHNAIRSDNMVSYTVSSNSNYFSAKDGVLYDYLGKTIVAYPNNKADDVFIMPEEVTTIASSAFFECDNLTSIILSPNLKTIEDGGFRSCSNLSSISIPDNVENIGYGVFDGCNSLSSIHIGAKVSFLAGSTFQSCNLSSITVSSNNQFYTVSGGKLYSKDMMTLVYYPCNLPGKTYAVPYGVKYIGLDCFYSANNLKSISVSETVITIGVGAFQYSEIETIYIPKSVTAIGSSAFDGCDNFTTVNYGGSSSDWINISIGNWNSILLQATRNYNFVND